MGKVLSNDFSWSKSRHEKFSECRRAYYFHYYLSWGGWDLTGPRWRRQLYILKKLSNRYTWGGSIVHAAIRGSLMAVRHHRTLDVDRLIDRVHRVMRQDFVFSRERKFWGDRIRKEFAGLVEHEYGETVAPEAWKSNWGTVEGALRWFFASPWLPFARSLKPEQWLEVDFIDFEKSVFFIDGVKIFAVPDFAYREHDGSTVIVDWKTGHARPGYDDQVLGYALYLKERYGLPLGSMRARLVYLNDGVEVPVAIEPEAITRFVTKFKDSVAGMRAALKDPTRNVPMTEEAFPRTDDLTTCARCVFRRPCQREQAVREARAQPQPFSTEPKQEPSP